MPRPISRTTILRAAALSLACALPAASAAQQGVPARRMHAFLRAVAEETPDSVAAYFPRRGEWTWVRTLRRDNWRPGARWEPVETGRVLSRGVWRFPAAATVAAIDAGGPACESFERAAGEVGPPAGTLSGYMFLRQEGGWRRVGRSRFVPPGAPARSSVFVEWRREGGEWVVSAVGDDRVEGPRVLGTERNTAVRDSAPGPPPPGPAYAGRERWYLAHEPIWLERFRYHKYGLPRVLAGHEIARIGRLGAIPVYVEAGSRGTPDVVYLPVTPGEYQPYNGFGRIPCR